MNNDCDDDDRALGLTRSDDPVVAPVVAAGLSSNSSGGGGQKEEDAAAGAAVGKEEEEEYLDLRLESDEDDDDNAADGEEKNDIVPLSDDALRGIDSKTEAKALGRELYKRWKKLRKRDKKEKKDKHHRHDSKKEKKSKHDGKKSNDKGKNKRKRHRRNGDDDGGGSENYLGEGNEDMLSAEDNYHHEGGGKSESKKKRKRSRREKPIALGDEDLGVAPFADIDEVLQVEESTKKHSRRHDGGAKGVHMESKPKKLSGEAQRDMLRKIAAAVVNTMRESRLKDEMDMNERRPPLHRVAVREYVTSQCRREVLHPFLIEEGILQELSTWLYDFTRNELSAFELRSDALDILLTFPIEGELDGGVAQNRDEILDAFTGMTREHLIHTELGSAVNALRQSKQEVHRNRAKAVRLLERLSRAMSGGVRSTRHSGGGHGVRGSRGVDGATSRVTWKCKDDPTVTPPFHIVQTGTEVFQNALARPDPLDPLSYLRVPPRRAPKAYVTNIGGTVGVE